MPEPRNYQTEAIVIKKTKLGEADTILTMYTPHLGKIQGFAKSLRKTKSKMAGHLELFTRSLVSFARGRNIDTITGAQTINAFLSLKNDLWLTSCALYATELVNQFTPEHMENEAVFQLLCNTLKQLGEDVDRELALRYFELQLMSCSGYRPQLRECVACHQPLQPITNYFCMNLGGVLCSACAPKHTLTHPITVNALKVMRLFQDSDNSVVMRLKTNQQLSHELDSIIAQYIKYLLEREVKSVAWLDTLRRQRRELGDSTLPHEPDKI